MNVTTLDIVVAILMAASLLLGWRKGLITQASSIVGVLAGIVAARLWGADAGQWLVSVVGEPDSAAGGYAAQGIALLGYAAVFILAWGWVWLLARMLKSAVKVILMGWADKLGGALFMALKWALVISLTLCIYALAVPAAPEHWGPLAQAMRDFAPWLWGMVSAGLPLPDTVTWPAG